MKGKDSGDKQGKSRRKKKNIGCLIYYTSGFALIELEEVSSSETATNCWKELKNEDGEHVGEMLVSLIWASNDKVRVFLPFLSLFF
jgi:hypothetical protein